MLIDNFVRVAVVLLAVSLGSFVGIASAEEGASPSQPVKQDVLSVKTLNLRWDQWNHEAGSELRVCPGRFRTINGEIRCRVPDGGLNGFLGGMVTGESMTAQETILKLAGNTAKIVDVTQNGDENRLQIKFSHQATGGSVSSFTDLSSIATRTPTEDDGVAKSVLGWVFGVAFGIVLIIVIIVAHSERKASAAEFERSASPARLWVEQASQQPAARVITPPPLVLQPTQPAPPTTESAPESTSASGRRLYLD
ncbi:hypothetical protein [Pseudomonas sp. TSRC2-2]|uniref:hypothetical protein n=1 Tax=Pseudomonas sp. TSRC2-2 TaxID=2804571 RepID=UPI003CE67CB2